MWLLVTSHKVRLIKMRLVGSTEKQKVNFTRSKQHQMWATMYFSPSHKPSYALSTVSYWDIS